MMLIRISGYNSGVKEYLETGVKNGREYTRDELDERVILDGDLDLTEMAYQSIPDKGQNRYTTLMLSFREDEISNEVLQNITKEMRDFIMYAYDDVEYNFYAEAHIPKIKEVFDKRTGEKIDRKPHIHIVIPKVNLLSGHVSDVIGSPSSTEKYLEAFQEYINQKYNLASPREHVRVNPYNAADVLSRYKGDDFRGKNREFKKTLVKEIIDNDIRTREGFYTAVSQYGETRIRNEGKENEYIAVKIPGDEKFTNLKETIFNDGFIIDRKLVRPPLAKHVIAERLLEWPMRAKEIKYVAKSGKAFRDSYYREADHQKKLEILSEQQFSFYEKFGGQNDLHPTKREIGNERSSVEDRGAEYAGFADGLQSMSGGNVAARRQPGITTGAVFLPGNARIHLEREGSGRNPGLRSGLHVGRTGRTEAGGERSQAAGEGNAGAEERDRESREGAEGTGKGTKASGEGTQGRAGQSRKRASQGGESETERWREDASEYGPAGQPGNSRYASEAGDTTNAGIYPDDPGSREEFRYAGIPELGRTDSSFRLRRGNEPGNRQLNIPVYARSPLKNRDISAIARNTKRLFDDSVSTPESRQSSVRLINRIMPRQPRNASYVAACLQRRQSKGQLTGAQRNAFYLVDKKYFETRRAILTDKRLTQKDKSQHLAVLIFERMKAHQQITQPERLNTQELNIMGSKDIKSNIKTGRTWRNSISGPEDAQKKPEGAKKRFEGMAQDIDKSLGERSIREKVRIVTAADLYTRKSKLSENIHYLDKATDKTLFIDTGKEIAVSKNGLNEAAVAVALELAKEKFGSSLTVKGTEAFKNTAIEVVAQKGLDIHFTDKEMNRRLAERKQELAVEREGQSISADQSPAAEKAEGSEQAQAPSTVDDFHSAFSAMEENYKAMFAKAQDMPSGELEAQLTDAREAREALTAAYLELPDSDPVNGPDKACRELESDIIDELGAVIDGERARETVASFYEEWQSNMESQSPAKISEFEAAFAEIEKLYLMLEENAVYLSPESLSEYMASGRDKRAELTTIYNSPSDKTKLDYMESVLQKTVTRMISDKASSTASVVATTPKTQQQSKQGQQSQQGQQAQQSRKPVSYEGVLLEHGRAPYNFKPDLKKPEHERDDSYYIKLQGAGGKEKVVWGVTLEKAVEKLEIGERVSLTNLGKEKVQWEQKLTNGQSELRTGERVSWEGRPLDREVDNEQAQQFEAYEQYQAMDNDGPSVA